MRQFLLASLLFGVAALTIGASPIADLLARVEVLESTVVTLGAENQTLSDQMATLEAESEALTDEVADLTTQNEGLNLEVASLRSESDKQPVVIDGNGKEVGTVVGFEWRPISPGAEDQLAFPFVMFEFDGVPRFVLSLHEFNLFGTQEYLFFESTDCSGIPHMKWKIGPIPQTFVFLDAEEVFLGEARSDGLRRNVQSRMNIHRQCQGFTLSANYRPAISVDAWEPFQGLYEVVTRGDLNGG